jgi:hypothetical protein
MFIHLWSWIANKSMNKHLRQWNARNKRWKMEEETETEEQHETTRPRRESGYRSRPKKHTKKHAK